MRRRARVRAGWTEGEDRVLSRLIRRFRRDPLRASVEESIRRGTGLRRSEWILDDLPIDETAVTTVAEHILEWCRDEIAGARRPYGIDQMALAAACAEPGGALLASASFGVFRPLEFYQEDGVGEQLERFIHSVPIDEMNRRDTPVRFAAALFSWGDVARDTIYSDEEQHKVA